MLGNPTTVTQVCFGLAQQLFYSYQLAWLRALLVAPFLAILGGRQIGKDFTLAFYLAMMLACSPGWNCVVISATNDDAKQMMRDVKLHYTAIEALCARFNVACPKLATDSALLISTQSNSTVRAVSATERGLLGTRGTVILNEVPAILEAEELVPSAMAQVTQQNRMKNRTDSRLVLLGNASWVGSFWYEWWTYRFAQQQAGNPEGWHLVKTKWSEANRAIFTERGIPTTVQEAIGPEGTVEDAIAWEQAQLIASLNGNEDAFEQWMECVFRSTEGLLCPPELLDAQLYNFSDRASRPQRLFSGTSVIGYDVGRVRDATAFIRLVETSKGKHYATPSIIQRNTPFPDQREKLLELVHQQHTRAVVVDANGLGGGQVDDIRKELTGTGVALRDHKRGPNTRWDLYGRIRLLLQQGKLFIPREDRELYMDLTSLEGALTDRDQITVKQPRTKRGHGDAASALAFAVSEVALTRTSGADAPASTDPVTSRRKVERPRGRYSKGW